MLVVEDVALLAALVDPVPVVRARAAEALAQFDKPEVIAALVDTLLDDEISEVRKSAATALGQLGSPVALEPLLRVIRNPLEVHPVRRAAAEAAGQSGDEALTALRGLLADPDASNRVYAVWGLLYLDHEQVFEPLLRALNDPASPVRLAAAFALGEFEDDRAIPALIGALTDAVSNVRYAAIGALSHLQAAQALPFFEKLSGDTTPTAWDETVGQAASKAIYLLRKNP